MGFRSYCNRDRNRECQYQERNWKGRKMSNLICPECGCSNILTERRLDGFHACLYCRHRWKIGESQPKPILFDRITASPEVLAPKLVYRALCVGVNRVTYSCWKSTITEESYRTKEEAHAATVEKLKEVCDDCQ